MQAKDDDDDDDNERLIMLPLWEITGLVAWLGLGWLGQQSLT